MGKKLGLIIIRGSGESGFEKQEKFLKKVYKKLEKKGVNTSDIQHGFVDYYGYMQSQQELLLERLFSADIKLRAKPIRKFLIANIGDLINYGGKPNLPAHTYEETHKLVYQSIISLKDKLIENAPLIVIASSFGSEIINNYIWDRQYATAPDPFGNSPFERFETMVGLFTFGSNIPIFAVSHDIDSLQPITFPSPNLDPNLVSLSVWENFYDKNDSLGYPVKPINSSYTASKVSDIQVNVGSLFTFWNFFSHFGYWNSRKIRKRITEYIQSVMTIL